MKKRLFGLILVRSKSFRLKKNVFYLPTNFLLFRINEFILPLTPE